MERTGRIDVVVNNAGATRRGEFLKLTDEDWTDGFALKFFGAVRLTRAAWPHLRAAAGSVVFISGIGGRTPGAEFAIGGSVNAALLSLTKALADSASVTASVSTPSIPGRFEHSDSSRDSNRSPPVRKRTWLAQNGSSCTLPESHELASPKTSPVSSLLYCSPENTLLHGAIIDLDGGATKTL